jgi:hypothetical protein
MDCVTRPVRAARAITTTVTAIAPAKADETGVPDVYLRHDIDACYAAAVAIWLERIGGEAQS